jgi:hypothetical protein
VPSRDFTLAPLPVPQRQIIFTMWDSYCQVFVLVLLAGVVFCIDAFLSCYQGSINNEFFKNIQLFV